MLIVIGRWLRARARWRPSMQEFNTSWSHESGLMELELHVARFLKNSKIDFKNFKKIGTKNLDIDNDEIY
jgi:hypothetical protein